MAAVNRLRHFWPRLIGLRIWGQDHAEALDGMFVSRRAAVALGGSDSSTWPIWPAGFDEAAGKGVRCQSLRPIPISRSTNSQRTTFLFFRNTGRAHSSSRTSVDPP